MDATTQGKQERLNGFLSALLLAEVVGSMASSFWQHHAGAACFFVGSLAVPWVELRAQCEGLLLWSYNAIMKAVAARLQE